MDRWKDSFLDKLNKAQSQWVKRFEEALDTSFVPVFEEYNGFLGDNGFKLSTPLQESGRRSFKFELAENAYVLLIVRTTGVGEFELRSETFAPSYEPRFTKAIVRIGDLNKAWAAEQLRSALDGFVDLLGQGQVEQAVGAVIEV